MNNPVITHSELADFFSQERNNRKAFEKVKLPIHKRIEILKEHCEKPIRDLRWHLDNYNEKPTEKNKNKILTWVDKNPLAMKLLPDDMKEEIKLFLFGEKLGIDNNEEEQ